MSRHRYKIVGILIGCLYWVAESLIHKYVFGQGALEIIPSEINELWMRIALFIMVVSLGSIADLRTRKIIKNNEEEKFNIYQATLKAVNHILNNFLNKTQLVRLEAEKTADFKKNAIDIYNQSLAEASEQIKLLNSITEISNERIHSAIFQK